MSKHLPDELMKIVRAGSAESTDHTVSENDVFFSVVRMGFGKGGKNPVTGNFRF